MALEPSRVPVQVTVRVPVRVPAQVLLPVAVAPTSGSSESKRCSVGAIFLQVVPQPFCLDIQEHLAQKY